MDKKLEVVYYELVKMEKRLEEKARIVLEARSEINAALQRFEILQKELLQKLEKESKIK